MVVEEAEEGGTCQWEEPQEGKEVRERIPGEGVVAGTWVLEELEEEGGQGARSWVESMEFEKRA